MIYTKGKNGWLLNDGVITADGIQIGTANLHPYGNGKIPEEFGNNARLIAAAPDMYEALKEAITILNALDPQGQQCAWTKQYIHKIIAKAEGK